MNRLIQAVLLLICSVLLPVIGHAAQVNNAERIQLQNTLAATTETGNISGKVTDEAGNPIAKVFVAVCTTAQDCRETGTGGAQTASDGSYLVSGLPTGSYNVFFNASSAGNYVSEWHHDKITRNDLELVAVVASQTTSGIDATLAAGGSISGKLTDETGNPVVGAVLVTHLSSGVAVGRLSGTDGTYTVFGIPEGRCAIHFTGWYGNYLAEWYNDKRNFSDVDAVDVKKLQVASGINATLSLGGMISGKVTNEAGNPVQGVLVAAYDSVTGLREQFYTYTNASGEYFLGRLYSGTYKVYFDADANKTKYASQWYSKQSTIAAAQPVSVSVPNTTAGIDVVLQPRVSIMPMLELLLKKK